jgi:aminoglycoside phosphotransferase (APT) family kinase protein
VQLTAWLSEQAFPAVHPAVAEPISAGEYVATVWHAVPPQPHQDSRTAHAALGRLLQELHALPSPPVALPNADPLARLRTALGLDTRRTEPVLTSSDHDFLTHRIRDLDEQYRSMNFPLGIGLIHNDAHPGNLLAAPTSRHGYVLTDWESACIGPREMDVVLAGAPGSRFDDTEDERLAFTTGYGYDIATWSNYRILRDIRDLHSLAGHIRAAPHHTAARNELRIRVQSLREDDSTVRWNAV